MVRSLVFDQGKVVGEDLDLDALRLARSDPGLHVWVDLEEPTQEEVKAVLEGVFTFHPLAIEDCVIINQLPKIEDYESYTFLVMHAVDFSRQDQFRTSELNLFLGREFLVTYHTMRMRTILAIHEKVKSPSSHISRSPDRIMHAILDMMIDKYKPVLDELAEEIQDLEDSLFEPSNTDIVKAILKIKKDINYYRSITRPQGEVAGALGRGQCAFVRQQSLHYFRDIEDNIHRFDAAARNLADQLLLAMDVFLNKAQHETNQIIKALAIMTALTIPIQSISGWYGMNFQGMPEISPWWGYPAAAGLTVASTVAILYWLRSMRWM